MPIARASLVFLAAFLGGCGLSRHATDAVGRANEPLEERARRLHREVPLIDGHNDLPWQTRSKAGGDLAKMDFRKPLPEQHTDLPRLKAGGVGGVFFAAYIPVTAMRSGTSGRMAIEQIDLIHRMVEHAPDDLELALTADDIVRIHRAGKIAALIGVEGGHMIEDSLGMLRQFYALGARYMTLTHTANLNWADSCAEEPKHGGLTAFGEEVVREMNRLGMMVDISHVSDDTMRDALRVTEAPVIFSHSSARAIAGDQPRDVPDDILPLVRDNNGVIMVNFYSAFLLPDVPGREPTRVARKRLEQQFPDDEAALRAAWRQWQHDNPIPTGDVNTVADHIDHLVKLAGIDHVGLGSDYDGISTVPVGLEDVSCFPNLTVELLRRGYSDEDVKKILGLNLLRVMGDVEKVGVRLRKTRGPSAARFEPASLLQDLPATRPAR